MLNNSLEMHLENRILKLDANFNKDNWNLYQCEKINSAEYDDDDGNFEEEAKDYFLNSEAQRKHKFNSNNNNLEKSSFSSTRELLLSEKTNYAIELGNGEYLNLSENSIFFDNNFFKNNIFHQGKKLQQKKSETNTNKEELVIREKLMYYYLNPRKNVAMPKFMKISTRDRKCQDMMTYKEYDINERVRQFYDEYPLLRCRKVYFKFMETLKGYLTIVKHPIFDNISLFIILLNTLFILISDPLDQNSLANSTDQYFLYAFSIEMVLKILAFGLVIPPNSYFRDLWNILDFLVVLVGWISYILEALASGQKISGLAGLRAFRILRPLKTIKSIKGLRRIIGTLMESMLALGDIVIVLFFFFLIFTIGGLQMWSGLFLRRCHSWLYGYPLPLDNYQNMCSSDADCTQYNNQGDRYYCAATIFNPNNDTTHFDNFINGLITVFIIATMEGWTDIYAYVSNTFKDSIGINTAIIFFYFHCLLFVGGYYLINLYLAVINTKYSEIEEKNRINTRKQVLSLYSILMDTFNNTTSESDKADSLNDGNNNKNNTGNFNANKDDIRQQKNQEIHSGLEINEEDKIKKIKKEYNLFNENLDEIAVSYEVLNDIFAIRTFTASELYGLKKLIISEADKALNEYKQRIKEMKKSDLLKKANSKRGFAGTTKSYNSQNGQDKRSMTDFLYKSYSRRKTLEVYEKNLNELSVFEELIPKSIVKTLQKFENDIKLANLEVAEKNKTKKIDQEKKKKKIQELFLKKIPNETGAEEIEEDKSSGSESDVSNEKTKDRKSIEIDLDKSVIDKQFGKKYHKKKNALNSKKLQINKNDEIPIEKKTTVSTDKKSTDEKDKKNKESYDLSFSVNTSDESSYSFGYINESINEENKIKNINNNFSTNLPAEKNSCENLINNKNNEKIKNDIKEKYVNNDKQNNKLLKDIILKKHNSAVGDYKICNINNNVNYNANGNEIGIIFKAKNIDSANQLSKGNKDKRENVLVKKTLINYEKDLYNKMIVVKPDNPIMTIAKYKEDNILEQKKELFKRLFKPQEFLDQNFQLLFKRKLLKDTTYLNFLKNTEEIALKYHQISKDELKRYEKELEDQSLNVSDNDKDPAMLVDAKDELSSLSLFNEEIIKNLEENSDKAQNQLEDYVDMYEKKVQYNLLNNYATYNKNEGTTNPNKRKRKSLPTLDLINNKAIKNVKKFDKWTDFKGGSTESIIKLNNNGNSSSSRNADEINKLNMNRNSNNIEILNRDKFNTLGYLRNNEKNFPMISRNKINYFFNLNSLLKYDNDVIIKYDIKTHNYKKLGRKRAFSVKKNEMKFPGITKYSNFNSSNNINSFSENINFNMNKDNKLSSNNMVNKVELKNYNSNNNNNANKIDSKQDNKKTNKERKPLIQRNNVLESMRAKMRDHYSNYRKYLKYINYIISKDFKVVDNFSVDDFYSDVMGKNELFLIDKMRALDINPIKIFNRSNINIKTNHYIKYLRTPILEQELVEIKNNLKNLPIKVLSSMDYHTKNFRYVHKNDKSYNYGKSGKMITINANTALNSKTSKLNLDKLSKSRSIVNSQSTIHKANTYLNSCNSSTMIKKNILKEIIATKQKNMNKIYTDFLALPLKNKIKEIFEKDHLPKNIENQFQSNSNIAKIKFDFDMNKEDIKNNIEKIRNYDAETNSVRYIEWSGHQVMNWEEDIKKYETWNQMIDQIESINVIIWEKNFWVKFIFKRLRYYFFVLSTNVVFEFFILFIVLINIIIMILSGNLFAAESQSVLKYFNLSFNAIFIFEFGCKFIGLGPIIYFSDAFTYLDFLIVSIAILDLTSPMDDAETLLPQNNKITQQLAFLKVFRIFRVVRIAKILRKIKSFKKILTGITNSLSNVAYNSLILFIFIIIFLLLGISFFSQDVNYQSFFASFFITFQLLTIENWNSVLYMLNQFNRLSVLYLISLIFIGNYILFNLFISILLNSFDSGISNDTNDSALDQNLPLNLPQEFAKYELMEREMKSIKNKNKSSSKNQRQSVKIASRNNSDEELSDDADGLDQMIDFNFAGLVGVKKLLKDRSAVNQIFNGNECEYSLFYFAQTSRFRLLCKNIVTLKKFDQFILFMILLSTLRLVIDTFLDSSLSVSIFEICDLFFTFIFLMEMILKTVAYGFVLGEGSYLQDNWNRIDFVIVVVSLIDLQNLISKYSGNLTTSSLNFLKVLRLLRTLRPLRFISHNVQLKIIITALIDSLGPITNVLIIVFIISIVFSIVGMTLFYELYHTCYQKSTVTPFAPILNFTSFLNFENPNDYNSIENLERKVRFSYLIKKF